MMIAIPIAIAANSTEVMSIIERHNAKPINERILKEGKKKKLIPMLALATSCC